MIVASTVAMLIFAAVTMNWFRVRSRWWETLLLALACVLLFRPDFFMDYLAPEYRHEPPAKLFDIVKDLPDGGRLVLRIKGTTIEGDDVAKTVAVRLGAKGEDGRKRLAEAGLTLVRARRLGADLRRQVRLAREEVGLRAGLGRRARRGAVRPGHAALVLPARVRAGRVRLVVAGAADARRPVARPRVGSASSFAPAEHPRMPHRIALIHALAHSVAPINAEFDRAWPQALRMNLLDDSLSADLARAGAVDGRMSERFVALADYALRTGASGILFTCSAFGPCIDAVRRRWPDVAVLKPNEAMIDDAVRAGRRIGLVASFAPTLASMPAEFPAGTELISVLAEGALDALNRGDAATHDRLVADAARRIAPACDAIALAQFSLARAAPAVAREVSVPVLTTPASAVRALRTRIEAPRRHGRPWTSPASRRGSGGTSTTSNRSTCPRSRNGSPTHRARHRCWWTFAHPRSRR